jgi:hypothetical protein
MIEHWRFNETTLVLLGFFLAWFIGMHGSLIRFIGDMIKAKDKPADVE